MNLVNLTHQIQVFCAYRLWSVVKSRSAQIQKTTLPCYWKSILSVDHRFALVSPIRTSAPDKKSFSIDSWLRIPFHSAT